MGALVEQADSVLVSGAARAERAGLMSGDWNNRAGRLASRLRPYKSARVVAKTLAMSDEDLRERERESLQLID